MSYQQLNVYLRNAIVNREGDAEVSRRIADFSDKTRIDKETLVLAAEFGNASAVAALTQMFGLNEQTQDYHDRALIAAAASHVGPADGCLESARILLSRGANPKAYEKRALMLAGNYPDKQPIEEMISQHLRTSKTLQKSLSRQFSPK